MDDKKISYALIITIVNRGFSDDVMDAAREAGAKGGTIMYAHGAGLQNETSFFGISIHPENEVVLILADSDHKSGIMQAIVRRVGLNSEGAGITFSLPVTETAGIAHFNKLEVGENAAESWKI